jgi:hypothetical protein
MQVILKRMVNIIVKQSVATANDVEKMIEREENVVRY